MNGSVRRELSSGTSCFHASGRCSLASYLLRFTLRFTRTAEAECGRSLWLFQEPPRNTTLIIMKPRRLRIPHSFSRRDSHSAQDKRQKNSVELDGSFADTPATSPLKTLRTVSTLASTLYFGSPLITPPVIMAFVQEHLHASFRFFFFASNKVNSRPATLLPPRGSKMSSLFQGVSITLRISNDLRTKVNSLSANGSPNLFKTVPVNPSSEFLRNGWIA